MENRILFVDDEPEVLSGIRKMLFKQRKLWDMVFVTSGQEGLDRIKERPFDLVVSDMRMPEMNGIEFLRRVKEATPQTVRMMLTGNTDIDTAIQAVNEGSVFRFMNKPCDPDHMLKVLTAGIEQYKLVTAEKELLNNTLSGSVRLMTEILTATHAKVFSYSLWLRDMSRLICRQLNAENAWEIQMAAMLGQIGYVALPPQVAEKMAAQQLTPRQSDTVRRLPEVGARLVKRIPRLEGVARIILYQDKAFNGEGFPDDNIKGTDIPLGARILKILKDADRFAGQRMAAKQMAALMAGKGHYDPAILETVLHLFVPYKDYTAAGEAQGEKVGIQQLKLGHKLLDPLEIQDGTVILMSGVRISPMHLEKIRMYLSLDEKFKEPIRVL